MANIFCFKVQYKSLRAVSHSRSFLKQKRGAISFCDLVFWRSCLLCLGMITIFAVLNTLELMPNLTAYLNADVIRFPIISYEVRRILNVMSSTPGEIEVS